MCCIMTLGTTCRALHSMSDVHLSSFDCVIIHGLKISCTNTALWLVQVKVYDLHGKNYGFTLSPTHQPIAEDNCMAVASKTRKNILITMQVDSQT